VTLFQKRLLILFSVALNIGFVIMAAVMVVNHPTSHHERTWRELVAIVQRMDLPAAEEDAAIATMTRFRETMNGHDRKIKQARRDIIRLLAADGPLDRSELHRLFEAAMAREREKSGAFEAHVMNLRGQLGDTKGARFFSQLLAHLDARSTNADR
jgi:exonuclease VII small subunit